ncbi:nucleolar complex-associated protein 3 [Cristinia sonorae]|uniref:Nucleolar complex-associated protein 3 n=1 Tax=Cristinia sonorae TaxID=1940300 RepID=A0A8K0UNP1_9AGAR|nr:nucleolar complex-associated protein 3 [Cristinia sonorae]
MVSKPQNKRSAHDAPGPSKKRKLSGSQTEKKSAPANGKKKVKGKERLRDRGFIPIPSREEDDGSDVSGDDMGFLEEYGSAAGFLSRLDEKGIARSKKETDRLRQLDKPTRTRVEDDDLPSIDSGGDDDDDEDAASWNSDIEDDDLSIPDSDAADDHSSVASSSKPRRKTKDASDDEEMSYEVAPRKRRPSWDSDEEKDKGISRLPIKLADGRVQTSSAKVYLPKEEKQSESESEEEEDHEQPRPIVEDVSTGARFGRPAVVDVIGNKSRKARLQLAKEQIASLCQEIISDPENSLGLLRRLHTFSLPEITTPSHPEPVPNDPIIRKLTILSQLAVFKDIIPGYRIRPLTEKEQAEKVSQIVQRTRDWEQGLVSVYQSYLKGLDAELKAKSELAEVSLQCMCTLLTEVTHFNFRINLMSSIVASLSRKSWDKNSDLCLNTVISVFRADNTGEASLELVRLLNRMVKERKFKVHPEVLSCLVHLRLRNEHGVRSSDSRADKPSDRSGKTYASNRAAQRRAKGKATDQPHLSKKAKKVMKERQEIQKEMREAEAEVDKEERAVAHTETLKLLFVLYFRILKNPEPTPLLPAALRGISRFAHLVNIDFFKDLMQVLKDLMSRESTKVDESDPKPTTDAQDIQHQLLCVSTAFELLSGQGEALEIDLSEFINRLYALIPTLSLTPTVEDHPTSHATTSPPPPTKSSSSPPSTPSDLLFRALDLAFSPRTSGASGSPPPWRSAAFAKRLLTASLHWPPATALLALTFVTNLVERDPKLEALLSTEDRSVNGVYRGDLDDPQVCNPFGTSFWEVHLLARNHLDEGVRKAARKLLSTSSGSG